MPYNEHGEWVVPEGFEGQDQETMFQLATTNIVGDTGLSGVQTIIDEMIGSNPDLQTFLASSDYGSASDLYSDIEGRLTSWDPAAISRK